ncbi:hypothetical protein EDD17DRAFT_1577441, partial [Pisolithus thermaeus]
AGDELFQAQVMEFSTSSKGATVLLFSSHQVLTEVLDDPLEFDFNDLHATTQVHDVVAE